MPARRVARPLILVLCAPWPIAALWSRAGLTLAFPRTLTIPFTCTAR